MLNQTQIATQTISFHGSELITLKVDDIIYTAVKPLVQAMGLDWGGQQQKLTKLGAKFNCRDISIVAKDGKTREMLCIPIRKLNGWLFSINPEKVRPDLKDRLIQYQEECFEALHDYWHKGVATRKPQALTAEHQATIKSLVLNRAKQLPKEQQAKATIMQWSALKSHFGKSYKEIDDSQFLEAVSLLARLPIEGELIIDNQINNNNLPSIQNSEETLALMIRLYSFCLQAYEMQQKLVSTGIDKQIRCTLGGRYLYNFDQALEQTITTAKSHIQHYIQHNADRLTLVKCLNDLLN